VVAQEIPYQLVRSRRFPGAVRLTRRQYQRIKRIFDLVICLGLLPFILIAIAVIAVIIRLDSPGSPFFVQERVGINGRRFKIYKFRSMWKDHDSRRDQSFMQAYIHGEVTIDDGRNGKVARFKPVRQEDLTRVGRFLRKTSLDELPQVFNVIRGEMSLIGPRPNVTWEVDAYQPWHYERLDVLPGITGLAQVMGRSDITFDQIARFDIRYARYQDLQMDMWILWQTVQIILDRSGAG
jgi:lipopolysaccharide/colanic/teichoic acid biosynthesis glycosyltransferase